MALTETAQPLVEPELEEGAEGAKKPENPQDMAQAVQDDRTVTDKRKQNNEAVAKIIASRLVQRVKAEKLSAHAEYAALAEIYSLVGNFSSKLETFGMGERAKAKVVFEIAGLFKVEIGQDFVIGPKETLGAKAEPYKAKFKVAILRLPLKVALGYEQSSKKKEESAMGYKDKAKQYLEIGVYENGKVDVKAVVERTEDKTKDEPKAVYRGAVTAKVEQVYGQFGVSMPEGTLSQPAVDVLLAMPVDSDGAINLGAIGTFSGEGGEVKLAAYGTF